MSRCFPFPPPGYEKKPRTDDTDLLKKEKHREKKLKKEKKDKEKREGKEKKEQDGSGGKRRDKKDRKEKHGDKKKDKEEDRDKDKDKSNISVEKSIAGQSEIYNGEKVDQKEREWDRDKSSVSNEKKGRNGENPMQNSILSKRAGDPNSTSNEKKRGHYGEKPIQNGVSSDGAGDSKFLQELARRIRDEDKGTGSQLVARLPVTDQKNGVRMDKVVVKDTRILAEEKQNNKGKSVDDRKIGGQGITGDTRSTGSAVVQNFAGMVHNRVGEMPRPSEKNIEQRIEEKEKRKETEGDRKQGDKRKDTSGEKRNHGKDKEREKEKKKGENGKVKSEHKSVDQDKFKDRIKNDHLDALNIKTSHVSKDSDRNTATEGNLKKRKDFETNGFLHENDIRPSKMPRPSPHPSTENGRKLVPYQTPILSTSDRLGPPNSLKVDNKERKVNGMIEAPSLSVSSKKSSAITQADQIVQASTKPPHPDSKYLSHVLSVPKMEEWSDFDDQEWLFSSRTGRSSEKPDLGSTGVTETPRVWDKALQIESADVCVLPYVIPY